MMTNFLIWLASNSQGNLKPNCSWQATIICKLLERQMKAWTRFLVQGMRTFQNRVTRSAVVLAKLKSIMHLIVISKLHNPRALYESSNLV